MRWVHWAIRNLLVLAAGFQTGGCDSSIETHIHLPFILNYRNSLAGSQTVKTEAAIQRDSTNSGTGLQVFAVAALSYALLNDHLYQLCIVPSSLRLIGKYARR